MLLLQYKSRRNSLNFDKRSPKSFNKQKFSSTLFNKLFHIQPTTDTLPHTCIPTSWCGNSSNKEARKLSSRATSCEIDQWNQSIRGNTVRGNTWCRRRKPLQGGGRSWGCQVGRWWTRREWGLNTNEGGE